jgi:hypothetical protein
LSLSTLAQIAPMRHDRRSRLARWGGAGALSRTPDQHPAQLNSLQLIGEIAEAKGTTSPPAATRQAEVLRAYRPPEVELADSLANSARSSPHRHMSAEANFRAAIEVLEEQMKMLGGTEEQPSVSRRTSCRSTWT